MTSSTSDTPIGPFWPHALALLAAALTWPLLMVGGTVTVYRVGMAVYDWPTTFGINMFVYNMFEASWGVFAEHAHRLYASVVGMSCILLACWYTVARLGWKGVLVMIGVPVAAALGIVAPTRSGPNAMSPVLVALGAIGPYALALSVWFGLVRRDVRLGLAWLALALVVAQGFLGGYRVTLNSTTLAFIHGCLAQAFFGLLIVLVVLTGKTWKTPVEPAADTSSLRRRSASNLVMIYAQIVVGAWVRHFGSEVAVGMHMLLGLSILGHVVALTLRTYRGSDAVRVLRPSVLAMAVFVTFQIIFGIAAYLLLRPFDGIPREVHSMQALVRISHQGVGALLLGASVIYTMRAFRRLTSPAATETTGGESHAPPHPRDLEPVQ